VTRARLAFALALAAVGCGAPTAADAGAADAGTADAGSDAGSDAGPRCAPRPTPTDPDACNGHAALCDRAFDDVAYPTTHNAMSSEEEGWIPPNQGPALWTQLTDGIRGFMLDVYEEDGETLLCHSICPLGSRPFVDALAELREFMDCHPTQVLTLILESYVDEPRVTAAFEAAGLLPYLHAQPADAPWPTLREMVTSGRRMVVLTQRADVTEPWHHHAYTVGWDNPYAAEAPEDLSCRPNRGDADNDLFILNHFLTAPVAMRSLAVMVNHQPLFGDQVARCEAEAGQLPNFVTVDFYEVGDLFEVVDALNRR